MSHSERLLPLDPNREAAAAPSSIVRSSPAVDKALKAARETKALEIGPGVLGQTAEVFRRIFPGQPAIVVCDPTLREIAGEAVWRQLHAEKLTSEPLSVLSDPDLYAEIRFVEQLEAAFQSTAAIPIAVGSGTINDLVKLAAHRTNRPYLCVATAASMDGYTAFGASITYRGSKQTFDCPAPTAVIADVEVIGRAPPNMTAAGYADLLAKVTAGADWILADALEVEKIDPSPWDIVQGGLRAALSDPVGARRGQPEAIRALTEGLLLGGFAMQLIRSSRPASGAEHQFSHLWDMEHHVHNGRAPSHGFKVGIATLAVAAFYEQLLLCPLAHLDVNRACAHWPTAAETLRHVQQQFSSTPFLHRALEETQAKAIDAEGLRPQLERLKRDWPTVVSRLREQLPGTDAMKRQLARVGAPTEPEEIGLSRKRLRDSFVRAYHIRRRFTVLDLAVRAGVFDQILQALFGRGGRWEIPRTENEHTSPP